MVGIVRGDLVIVSGPVAGMMNLSLQSHGLTFFTQFLSHSGFKWQSYRVCHCIMMSEVTACQSHYNYYLETFDNNSNDKQMTSVLFLVSKCSQCLTNQVLPCPQLHKVHSSQALTGTRPCALSQLECCHTRECPSQCWMRGLKLR